MKFFLTASIIIVSLQTIWSVLKISERLRRSKASLIEFKRWTFLNRCTVVSSESTDFNLHINPALRIIFADADLLAHLTAAEILPLLDHELGHANQKGPFSRNCQFIADQAGFRKHGVKYITSLKKINSYSPTHQVRLRLMRLEKLVAPNK